MSHTRKIEVPIQSKLNLAIFFLSVVCKFYRDDFLDRGANVLNYRLQERAGMSREDAFALIADALATDLIRVEGPDRGIAVDDEIFLVWRDVFASSLSYLNSCAPGKVWPVPGIRRELTEKEAKILDKNILKGRLAEYRNKKEKTEQIDWSKV